MGVSISCLCEVMLDEDAFTFVCLCWVNAKEARRGDEVEFGTKRLDTRKVAVCKVRKIFDSLFHRRGITARNGARTRVRAGDSLSQGIIWLVCTVTIGCGLPRST